MRALVLAGDQEEARTRAAAARLAIENSHPFPLAENAVRRRCALALFLAPQTDAVDGPSARIAALAAEHLAAATASRIPAISAKMIVGIITMR